MLQVSVPGSVFILGEYGVLAGYPAIAAAINKRLHIKLILKNNNIININNVININLADLKNINYNNKINKNYFYYRFVLASLIEGYKNNLFNTGFDLIINSAIDSHLGLGSSAAVTVGCVAILKLLNNKNINKKKLLQSSANIIRTVQNGGSGTDAAASIYGGLIYYHPKNYAVKKLNYKNIKNKFNLIYTGYKTPTDQLINNIYKNNNKNNIYKKYYKTIGKITELGEQAIIKNNINLLSRCFLAQQKIMRKLGVSDDTIENILTNLAKMSSISAAKISGGGLGDCILALGKLPKKYSKLPITIDSQGVKIISP